MPLEHFGAPRIGDTKSRAERPRSEPGLSDARRAGVSRAASDARALSQARERIRTERYGRNDDEDDAILSKLTGVSRSVSWGRAQANQRGPRCSNSNQHTPRSASARVPSTSRFLSHHASASLSMSPSIPSNNIPEDDESQSQKSSPASSAAFSLRSFSSLSRRDSLREPDSSMDEMRSWQHIPGEHGSEMPQALGLEQPLSLSPNTQAQPSLSPVSFDPPDTGKDDAFTSVTQERLDQDLPPLPSIDVEQVKGSQHSPDPALDLAVPLSPRSQSTARLSDDTQRVRSGFLSSPVSEANSSSPVYRSFDGTGASASHEAPQFNIARKHAGSFQSRVPGQGLSQSMQSLTTDDPSVEGPYQGYETPSRTKLTRFFSRIFNEPRSQSGGSESDGIMSFSPRLSATATSPISNSHPHSHREGWRSPGSDSGPQRTPYTPAPSLMQLTSKQILPRPPRSPLMAPLPTQDDDLDDGEKLQEIHGLPTRSSTPVRSLSPASARRSSTGKLGVPAPHTTPQSKSPILEQLALEQKGRSISDYDIGQDMGSGAYGFVRHARLLDGEHKGEDVVVKYIIKNCILADSWRRHRIYGTIPAEIFVLLQLQHTPYTPPPSAPPWIKDKVHWMNIRQQLLDQQQRGEVTGHPGICKLIDFFEDEEYYYLVMPRFGDGQDLFDYVESSPFGLDPSDIRSFLGQVCDVIAYMHANSIVHRDIKDENVILDRFGMTQLIDFGSAARLRTNRQFDTFSGTMDYAAAEIIQGKKYSGPPQDIWAFGVMAYVLVCGECPFRDAQEATEGLSPDSRPMQVLRHFCFQARRSSNDSSSTTHSEFSREERDGGGSLRQIFDLICQCLQIDPEQRPSAQELLQHRFLQGAAGWLGVERRRADLK